MRKYLFITLFLSLGLGMIAQTSNNKYEKDWEQIEQYKELANPQSAINALDEMLERAVAEENSTQVIKIYINRAKFKKDIFREGDTDLAFKLEEMCVTEQNAALKALLHSIIAEDYAAYYKRHHWKISQRSALLDVVPEDVEEWSTNLFITKITEHLEQSIQEIEVLKKHTTKEFDDIILLGQDKDKYPTMYDFLMKRAIDVLKKQPNISLNKINYKAEELAVSADEYVRLQLGNVEGTIGMLLQYYQNYQKDLMNRNLIYTVGLMDIDRFVYLKEISDGLTNSLLLDAFLKLTEKYESNEVYTEIISKLIGYIGYFDWRERDKEQPQQVVKKQKYDWIQKGLNKYPNSYGARVLTKDLNRMEEPSLSVSGKYTIYPKKETELAIVYKNTQKIRNNFEFNLVRVEGNDTAFMKAYSMELISETTFLEDTVKLNLGVLPYGSYYFTLKNEEQEGYQLQGNSRFEFVVSSLISFTRNKAKGEYEIFVVDRQTGKPINGADVTAYTEKSVIETVQTNDLGVATLFITEAKLVEGNQHMFKYAVASGADKYMRKENIYLENYRWNNSSGRVDTKEDVYSIFTDRSIYRPGQTVYYKSIVLDYQSNPVPNKRCEVKLYNTNGDVVAEKKLRTNEFGSVAGEFVLPTGGLPGSYRINVDGKRTVEFSVEEYKRPTFDVTFDKITETYAFNEEVRLKGYAKNFSGILMQDAEVAYTIRREQFSFWRWQGGDSFLFDEGTVKTKEDGSFEIVFTPLPGDEKQGWFRDKNIYTFKVTASVTDLNGETQESSYTVHVSNLSMVIHIEMPDKLEKSSNEAIKFEAKNLEGEEIETSGTYVLYTLDKQDSIKSKVLEGEFQSGAQADLQKKLKKRPSGKYRLEVKAKDSKGNELIEKKDFLLFAYKDKRPPIQTNQWLVAKKATFSHDKPAEIIYGVSDKDIYVYYQLHRNEQVLERKVVKLSKKNRLFTIPYKEEYGDEIYASFTFVKDEKMQVEQVSILKEAEEPDIHLQVKLDVFRDKLRPGDKETWTISVKDSSNAPVESELLASMYDTSLDKLKSFTPWTLVRPTPYKERVSQLYYNQGSFFRIGGMGARYRWGAKESSGLSQNVINRFDILNWFDYIRAPYETYLVSDEEEVVVAAFGTQRKVSVVGSITSVNVDELSVPASANALGGRVAGVIDIQRSGEPGQDVSEFWVRGISSFNSVSDALVFIDGEESDMNSVYGLDPADIMSFSILKDASATAIYGARGANGVILVTTRKQGIEPEVRKNFQETAFFYPQLRTNEQGETRFQFTVPESNTTWRFRALAHDKQARSGLLEQFVVSKKELMVTPNLPRFFREGDKTSISTKVSNLSDVTQSGNVHIVFFDPITEKELSIPVEKQRQFFTLEKGASDAVAWTFEVPKGMDLLGCRIVAETETFSDGEQHALAVLSNRMLVTEAMPMTITKAGTHTFKLDKLMKDRSSTKENYRLTLEYAANPAWYAVQALPTMSLPTNENAVSWFASYYVNSLGASIVKQYPKVSSMIQAWTKQGGDKETLVSKLQKNEELKAVLLEETPWVLEAKDETEQMRRLSLLFDLNNTKQLTTAATTRLRELMNADGGWAWYKGMYSSRSITQYILYGYAKLREVGQMEYPDEIIKMQMEALRFADKCIVDDFERLKKNDAQWQNLTTISIAQLEYAYVRSHYRDIPINEKTREAERFYTAVASKNWTKLSLYGKSLLVVLLNQDGDKELAKKVARSISEYAVKDKEMGMYWPNNRTQVFMSLSAISTHVFLMEALESQGASKEEMNLMRLWLLNQKRTQSWESTHATMDAINALLTSDWLDESADPALIQVGGVEIEAENKELGTNYFKKAWTGTAITPQMGEVKVTTKESAPSFGGLYWQYFEDLDKITAQDASLSVQKQLFKEENTSTGKGLREITTQNPLKVGDRVTVRITVRTDRDMDFVHIKDMRASCFEPLQTISGIEWRDQLLYYRSSKDASTNFFIDVLPKGTYVLEYSVVVNRTGIYSNGITSIQSMYAPEFTSHSAGETITVSGE